MVVRDPDPVPAWQLYGERTPFPDVLHLERIRDRAAGLDWRIGAHRHAHLAQVFLIQQGMVSFSIAGETRDSAGPFILFLPPGVVHAFRFSAGAEGWVLTVPTATHPEVFREGGELARYTSRYFWAAPARGLTARFAALAADWRGQGPLRQPRLHAGLIRLFCDIFDDAARSRRPRAGEPRLSAFLALIARHHAEHWSVARYAAELGMSVRTLSRICVDEAGLGPHQLAETYLMREACRLLAYTQMPAQQVAFRLGFQDPSYFNRRFRHVTGLSPGAYRRQLEAGAPDARPFRAPGG